MFLNKYFPFYSRGSVQTSASVPDVYYGLSGWAGTSFAGTAAGLGLKGSANTPLWRAGIFRVDNQSVSATRLATSYFTGGTGWRQFTGGFNDLLQFDIINGAIALKAAPTFTITAGMVGKMIHWYGYFDGAGVGLVVNGVSTGTPTAETTYAEPSLANPTSFGARSNGQLFAQGLTLFGLCGGDGVKTIADAQAHYAACKAQKKVVYTGADHAWDIATNKDIATSLNLPDLVGSHNMVRTGPGTGIVLETVTNPTWV